MLGVGKVFKDGNARANAFIEPRFTIYHHDPDIRRQSIRSEQEAQRPP
jgi:hypothetical protein